MTLADLHHASEPERALETLLKWNGIQGWEREYRFDPKRRWRFDFAWPAMTTATLARSGGPWTVPVAVEVEGGSFTGGHRRGRAYELDCEKANEAALAGWVVLRVTPAMISDGRAIALIKRALEL